MGAALPIILIAASAASATAAVVAAAGVITVLGVIAAVVSVAATAASIYFYCQGDIQNTMLFAGIGIAGGIGSVYISSQAAISQTLTQIAAGQIGTYSFLNTAYSYASVQMVAYINSIYSGMLGFLGAIHFKTILAMHQIGMVLSQDYRNMMGQVFGQMASVSVALGHGADYLNLLMRNTRQIVLDSSAIMGRPYDISELVWANTFSDIMGRFSQRAHQYAQNPANLFWDLDQEVIKPAVDTKASVMQIIILTTERLTEAAKVLVDDIVLVRNDLGTLVSQLPSVLAAQIQPSLKPIFEQIDRFVTDIYRPAIEKIDKSLIALGVDISIRKQHIAEIVDRLRFPGKILSGVDSLPDDERLDEERALYYISNREGFRTTILQHAAIQDDWEAYQEMLSKKPVVTLKPPERPGKMIVPKIGEITLQKTGKGWYIGDF